MGNNYDIKSDASAEIIKRVASHVDETMIKIRKAGPYLDRNQIQVLTAMDLAEEYLKTKDELEACKRVLAKYKHEDMAKSFRR